MATLTYIFVIIALMECLDFGDADLVGICKTTTEDVGKKCVFPFIYTDDGQTYNGCSVADNSGIDSDGIPWCATETTDGKYVDGSKKWGNCNSACPECLTTDDKMNYEQKKCVFPFIYNFNGTTKTYKGCTTVNNNDKPWCATDILPGGQYHNNWGHCNSACPGGPECITITKEKGKKCVFPFIYEYITYNGCSTVDNSDKPWCAVDIVPGGEYVSGKWGNCPIVCQ